MVDLGDVLMSDKLKNASNIITRDTIAFRAKLMRDYYAIQSHAVPMFFVLGNHEGESGWSRNGTANNVAVPFFTHFLVDLSLTYKVRIVLY